MSNHDLALSGSGTASTLGRDTPDTTPSAAANALADLRNVASEPDSKTALPQPQSSGDPSQFRTEAAGVCESISYASFRVGQRDPKMGVIIKEILFVNDHAIVYIDEGFCLQWHWCFELDAKAAAPVFNRACELEAIAQFLRHQKNQQDLLSAVRLIGEGVVELFSAKDNTYANAALDTADKFVTQRARDVSRRWYFIPFLMFFATSALVILVSYFLDSGMTKWVAIVCTFAGGIGSFISRALDNDNIPIAATAGRMLHRIEATLRWCIGLTAGLIVWLLVTGNVAGSFLNTTAGQNTFALIAIAILAGASERLLPSLIQSFDKSIKKNGQTSQSDSKSGPS